MRSIPQYVFNFTADRDTTTVVMQLVESSVWPPSAPVAFIGLAIIIIIVITLF